MADAGRTRRRVAPADRRTGGIDIPVNVGSERRRATWPPAPPRCSAAASTSWSTPRDLPFGPTADTEEASFDAVYASNVKAPSFLTAALAPAMAVRGHGAIVNVTTMVAEFGAAGMGLYGSTKAALGLLTRSWAAEYGPSGGPVNAVSPGPTRTEGTASMGEALDQLAAAGPAGRPGTPEEIASAIVFLASDAASFIHGAILSVDGGRIAV